MSDPWWISRADPVSKWATIIAILAGGIWALYHFYLRRESQTALTIDLTTNSVPSMNSANFVNFDVALTNKGQVAVRARQKIRPAYKDLDEELDYGGDLLVRKISSELRVNETVDWFTKDQEHSPRPTDLQVDLLRFFRNDKGLTDFWIEPGEVYHVGSTLVLAPGSYLVMVTFVGDRSPSDFWRRVFLVQVPVPTTNVSSGGQAG